MKIDMYKRIGRCRICGNPELVPIVDLGEQYLTGVFPRERRAHLTKGPLCLVKCHGGPEVCGLVQLQHSYDPREMYGDNYGYHSGLNASMVRHLQDKVSRIRTVVDLRPGDLVVDVGSNDGTTLGFYPDNLLLVGVDPAGAKFRRFYAPHVRLLPDFFSADLVSSAFPGRKAKVVTSIAMFYDLEDPTAFMREVCDILDDDGIWVFEQSYMPAMLDMNAYDTVCHEHLEYYSVRQVKWMADRAGLKIIDIEFNRINGGSFSVTAAKQKSHRAASADIGALVTSEASRELDSLAPYRTFAECTARSRDQLIELLETMKASGKTVMGVGASTKGNVVLQYCGIDERLLPFIGEVNADKFGCFTPGTLVPIVPEDEVLARNPDHLLILPWHFREFFETSPRFRGRSLIFPLPVLETVTVA